MKKDLLILTSSFPYEGGEQFIESEAPYWENLKFDNVYLLPNSFNGQKRVIPETTQLLSIKIDNSIVQKLWLVFLTFFQPFFYKEIKHILVSHQSNVWQKSYIALKNGANILRQKKRLNNVLKKHTNISTIYCYWNDVDSYAACLTSKEVNVIARTHRFDLYQEGRPFNYMPYKWQFSQELDKVFLLSPRAKNYYHTHYNVEKSNLVVSRLGVQVPSFIQKSTPKNNDFMIVSTSYCVPVKRIDKIFLALQDLINSSPDLSCKWVHIGGGDLYESFKQKIEITQNNRLNISFLGHQSNSFVTDFLKTNNIHVFINVSESEGTPVSIMEAMAEGIPVIAPDVGGIYDIVEHLHNGYLMSEHAHHDEIIKGIQYVIDSKKWDSLSQNAHKTALSKYNASLNFPEFLKKLEAITDLPHE